LVIVSELMSAVTGVREIGERMLTGNDLAYMDDKVEE